MTIQWYPGHMHKAQKEMAKVLREIDVVIEVTDARIPFSSENPMLGKLVGDKPSIKILHKGDMADMPVVREWQDFFMQQRGVSSLVLSIGNVAKIARLPELVLEMLSLKQHKRLTVRAMIAGIPNVGKSSIINALAGRAITKTGNEPAVTKSQQYIHIRDDFLLLDTPGILWPKQEREDSSYRLALTGAIKDTVIDYPDLADFALEFLAAVYPERLKARYEIEVLPETTIDLFDLIARKRGCIAAGGKIDYQRAGKLLVSEIRSGQLGQLCFETPTMFAREAGNTNTVP